METNRERIQREREKQETLDSLPLRQDYRETFSTPEGRRVLAHMLLISHQDNTTFTGNSLGMFQEGARAFVLMIKGLIPVLMAEVELELAREKELEFDKRIHESLSGERQ